MAIDFPATPSTGQTFTSGNQVWTYNGVAWTSNYQSSGFVRQQFTATAGQTSFTVSGGYSPSLVDVYQNGVKLVNGSDVTVTSGTSVVLAVGAAVGDIIEVLGFSGVSGLNYLSLSGGNVTGTVNVSTAIGIGTTSPTNEITVYSNDAGATGTPLAIELYRDSASPADQDLTGRILFTGRNSAGTKIELGSIYGGIYTASTGRGKIVIAPASTGVETNVGLAIDDGGAWWSGTGGIYLGLGIADGSTGRSGLELYSHTANTNPAYFGFFKSRGTSTVPTAVQSSDQFMNMYFNGYNGTAYVATAQIIVQASEAWTASATGSHIRFQNTTSGTTGVTEKMRLSGGNLGIGTTNPLSALQISGNFTIENDSAIYWNGYWDGTQARAVAAGFVAQIYTSSTNGAIAFYTSTSSIAAGGIAGQTERARITPDGFYKRQPAPTAKSAAATLTAAEVLTFILTYSGTAATITLPTGTDLDTAAGPLVNNLSFDWSVVNTSNQNCTIAANTGITFVGSALVPGTTSATFRFRRNAANTFIVYRIG